MAQSCPGSAQFFRIWYYIDEPKYSTDSLASDVLELTNYLRTFYVIMEHYGVDSGNALNISWYSLLTLWVSNILLRRLAIFVRQGSGERYTCGWGFGAAQPPPDSIFLGVVLAA